MINVLFPCFDFPPVNASKGTPIQFLNIVKALRTHGIETKIYTTIRNSPRYFPIDKNQYEEIPKDLKITRIPFYHFFGKLIHKLKLPEFFIPDNLFSWIFACISAILVKERKNNFDVILVIAPHFTSFIIGCILKFIYKKPLIIGYDDPWNDNPYTDFILKHRDRANRILEKLILKYSDGQMYVSKLLQDETEKKYPFLKKRDSGIVSMLGIKKLFKDEELLEKKDENRDITLVSMSSLYGKRDPEPFLKIIGKAKKKGLLDGTKFRLLIYGRCNEKKVSELIIKYGLEYEVSIQGEVHRSIADLMMRTSTMLVDFAEKNIDYPSIPMHLCEYIGTGKKILHLGKHISYKSKFISENNLGIILPQDKPKIMENKFFRFLKHWKKGDFSSLTNIQPYFYYRFSWHNCTNKLSKLIKKLAKKEEK